jgi:hypothetical protein
MSATPDDVTLRLLEIAMQMEKQLLESTGKTNTLGKYWVLKTYAECQLAVAGAWTGSARGSGSGEHANNQNG